MNAETAITFGGVSTTLVGDIGIAPGTAITGQFTNGPTDIVHYTDTAAANCAADFKNIDVKAAGASPCVSIASELGENNDINSELSLQDIFYISVPKANHITILFCHFVFFLVTYYFFCHLFPLPSHYF